MYERTSEENIKFGKWLRTFIRNSTEKFELDSFKICDRSTVSKMTIRYNLSRHSMDTSSISSVKLLIIWENLEKRVLKTWDCYFAIIWKFHHFFSFKDMFINIRPILKFCANWPCVKFLAISWYCKMGQS